MKVRGAVLGLALAAILGACGGSGGGSTTEPANSCAVRGATYIVTQTELPGGSCGPISPDLITVNQDGTITDPEPTTCAMWSQTGCTSVETNCTYQENGYTDTFTRQLTFTTDGSSATGQCTFSASGHGLSCSSTYSMTVTREGADGG
jgi:hypothetical protein